MDPADDRSETAERRDPRQLRRHRRGSFALVLGTAMVALGEILEPHRLRPEIVHVVANTTGDDDVMRLDFGDLEPLDPA